jgi:hypothetical protein
MGAMSRAKLGAGGSAARISTAPKTKNDVASAVQIRRRAGQRDKQNGE